jgi:hypothetical protein
MTTGFYANIGNGNASVWIEYRAERDYDSRGPFWEIDWDAVKVHFGDLDITDTVGDSIWNHIEELINEDLAP